MIGRTISHYRVEKRLGAGGMGDVYLACDLALGRDAALKLLPEGFDEALKARLLLEAETCARLQHPAIATFFEAGSWEGGAFIAMEYVLGRTLRDRLGEGPLPVAEAVSMAGWLLEALAHAHAAGILHRDVKPENVMLTKEGAVKLLDFGIAKLFGPGARPEEATAVVLTAAGEVLGTAGYMSPEQVRGEPVDSRSDLFSLGTVLYEALSGRPAFPGLTVGERVAAILARDPPPLAGVGVPPELSALLSRALAREPSARYDSAASFLSDLRRATAGEYVAALPDTLAILDLENLSRDPDDDWVGSGVAEGVAAELARVSGLSVVAREKAVKVRRALATDASPLDFGHALGCRWVLSGSYQRMGPLLRITARLFEVATGQVVSTEKLDGKLDGIFEMQDRLASVTAAVLNRTCPTVPASPSRQNLDAYESYARGRRLFHQLAKGSFDQARVYYEQAVAADPRHAPALGGLSGVAAMRFTFTTDPAELSAAADFARRAIAVDERLSEPRIWLGYALWRQGMFEAAFDQEQKAMELEPANPFGPYFAGTIRLAQGRPDEALPLLQRAVEADPQHGWSWLSLGWAHMELGRTAEALWSLEKAAALEERQPQSPTAGVSAYLGECLRRSGDAAGAYQRCLRGLEAVEKSDHMYRDTFRGYCLCAMGRAALDRGETEAAHAAFAQAVLHLRGRPRALGGGQLLVQALAGLSRSGEGLARFTEARHLFESRRGFDFSYLFGCSDDVTLLELSHAAAASGKADEANALLTRARAAGPRPAGSH